MRVGRDRRSQRRWSGILLGVVTALLVLAAVPRAALAEEALLVEPAAPAAVQAPAGSVEENTIYVEDPTRMAGGEDDAQRASERSTERQQDDDDGDKRRK